MIKVSGTTITMTRGDTLILTVGMNRGSVPYTPAEGDTVRFAVKSKLNPKGTEFVESNPIINKQIPTETMVLRLDPTDTKQMSFGTYTYDIQITYADESVDTFIADAKLIIAPEVH